MIIERMKELEPAIEDLRDRFVRYGSDSDLLMHPFNLISEISEWKYSTADNFDPEPYHNEVSGMKSGRIIKRKYDSPFSAKLKGQYSSGFIDGQLVLTIHPSEIDSSLSVSYFMAQGGVKYRLAILYRLRDETVSSCRLRSIQSCLNIDASCQVFILKGESDEVSISAYESHKGLLVKAYVWSSRWPVESVRHLHYCGSELSMITGPSKGGGEIEIWRKPV
ncbi:hypothetical protein [Serratia ureilytica]|uniref:hypothetical protein n=1 Tax=Serratia ureilytica TaxID=300181 RepID=UPI001D18D997|nr:hypothetical protein [Serratia ureilytica]MCC4104750.1 hypothetical protein [Serratia ureilytica]